MKKKKTLIAIIALLFVVVVGVTFAYFQGSTSFVNIFDAGEYKVSITEEFTSPNNWAPGETIPKVVKAKNVGNVDTAVRISYTEKWEDLNGTDITSQVTPNPAIINFDNTSDWIHSGNYYYYKYILKENDETSRFISGVTLDPTLNSVTCTGSGNTRTCEANNPATGAVYKLTITIDTIQYDVYKTEWTPDVEIDIKHDLIELPDGRSKDNLQLGDEICIYADTTECFYFTGYDGNDIKMLSKWNLKVGDILDVDPNYNDGRYTAYDCYPTTTPGYGLQSSEARGYLYGEVEYGAVGFSSSAYWLDGSSLRPKYGNSFPADVYDNDYAIEPDFSTPCTGNNCWQNTNGYTIAYYVENYKDVLESYGVTIEEARLLTYDEATNIKEQCPEENYSCSNNSFIVDTSYWLGTVSPLQSKDTVYGIYRNDDIYRSLYYKNAFGVRPLIKISKSLFE